MTSCKHRAEEKTTFINFGGLSLLLLLVAALLAPLSYLPLTNGTGEMKETAVTLTIKNCESRS